MNRRASLFINPGAAAGLKRDSRATDLLRAHFNLTIHETSSAAELFAKARAEALAGCEFLIGGGGDGTLNSIINALAGTDATLGILPLGTANDLARELNLPSDPLKAAERIIEAHTRQIDLIEVTPTSDATDAQTHRRTDPQAAASKRFATAGGMGIVTRIAALANEWKASPTPIRAVARALGNTVYAAATVPIVLAGGADNSWDITLDWIAPDNTPHQLKQAVQGVFFTNQSKIAGDLTLPVPARNDDGIMDICVIAASNPVTTTLTGLALKNLLPLDPKSITTAQATSATLTAPRPFKILGDGEPFSENTHFTWKVLPRALPVLT